jgi:hypothetical protein
MNGGIRKRERVCVGFIIKPSTHGGKKSGCQKFLKLVNKMNLMSAIISKKNTIFVMICLLSKMSLYFPSPTL